MRVGLLEVLGALPYARLEVRCDCGVTKTIRKSDLGSTKSCGCQRARRRLPVGFRSHQLVVPQRHNVDFRDEDGLDRWSVADDLRGQVK